MTNTELKQIRLAMNLRQKDLAKLLHVNYMTISRWENGYWPIPEDKAELLGYKWKEHNTKLNEHANRIGEVWRIV